MPRDGPPPTADSPSLNFRAVSPEAHPGASGFRAMSAISPNTTAGHTGATPRSVSRQSMEMCTAVIAFLRCCRSLALRKVAVDSFLSLALRRREGETVSKSCLRAFLPRASAADYRSPPFLNCSCNLKCTFHVFPSRKPQTASGTGSAAEAPQTPWEREADTLFRTHTIAEVKTIERSTRYGLDRAHLASVVGSLGMFAPLRRTARS